MAFYIEIFKIVVPDFANELSMASPKNFVDLRTRISGFRPKLDIVVPPPNPLITEERRTILTSNTDALSLRFLQKSLHSQLSLETDYRFPEDPRKTFFQQYDEGGITIGSNESCHLYLTDTLDRIGGNHGRITYEAGHFWIQNTNQLAKAKISILVPHDEWVNLEEGLKFTTKWNNIYEYDFDHFIIKKINNVHGSIRSNSRPYQYLEKDPVKYSQEINEANSNGYSHRMIHKGSITIYFDTP